MFEKVIKKELPKNKINLSETKIKKLFTSEPSTRVSMTYGVYSQYTFNIFLVTFPSSCILKLTDQDRWVTSSEILSSSTDNHEIIQTNLSKLLEKHKVSLDSLPLSLVNPQPLHKSTSHKSKQSAKSYILELINSEESSTLEFKSSLRWDYYQQAPNKELEMVVIKTIAGFMNYKGGTLIIGVDDQNRVLGLKNDLSVVQKGNIDGFFLHLNNLIASKIGTEYSSLLDIKEEKVNDKSIVVVKVMSSNSPVFVQDKDRAKFFLRVGNGTRELDSQATYKYIKTHFK